MPNLDWEDDGEPLDFGPEARRVLLVALGAIVSGRTAHPAYDLASRLLEREQKATYDLCPGDSVAAGEQLAIDLATELRQGVAPPDPIAAVRWVRDQLGAEHGRRALRVADLLGHPDAPPWPGIDPPVTGDEPLLPALVLLLAGVAATGGEHG